MLNASTAQRWEMALAFVSSSRCRNAPNTSSIPGRGCLGIHRTQAHRATPPLLQTRKLYCEPMEAARIPSVPACLNEPLLPRGLDNAFAELLRARKEHFPPLQQRPGPTARMPANGYIPRTLCGSDPREPASVVGGLADWQCVRLFFQAW